MFYMSGFTFIGLDVLYSSQQRNIYSVVDLLTGIIALLHHDSSFMLHPY